MCTSSNHRTALFDRYPCLPYGAKALLESDFDDCFWLTVVHHRRSLSKIFNDAIPQGQARALAEFYASKTPPTAQAESKEAVPETPKPEANQPPVEPSALSEASQIEAAPEMTQPPEEIQPPKESSQQQQWVDSLAPDLAQLLSDVRSRSVTYGQSPLFCLIRQR
ncbi:hypothetical protein [Moorena sp. SIO3I6]|uniref:hypothetical protein n=2 Tax=Coleofasciculaceae TaxID=1892251 RepID=UPI0013F823A3|nr:hypothetical protein [Moorena sp. SIO3I6]NEP24345.1 hypothetical protein [Moorena sp. SIO3I6]